MPGPPGGGERWRGTTGECKINQPLKMVARLNCLSVCVARSTSIAAGEERQCGGCSMFRPGTKDAQATLVKRANQKIGTLWLCSERERSLVRNGSAGHWALDDSEVDDGYMQYGR